MATAVIDRDGRISVPAEVLRKLGVKPGDRLHFTIEANGRIAVSGENVDLRNLRGSIRPRRRDVTVSGMNAAIRIPDKPK